MKMKWYRKSQITRIFAIIFGILTFFSIPQTTVSAQENPGALTVHFLDVGQGVSVLLESDGHYAIYDGGGPERSSYVVSYLQEQGIESFDYIIASHYDLDHISGLVGVVNVFPANTILGPNYVGDTDIYASLINKINEKDESIVSPSVGDTYTLGSATLEVLAPLELYADPNECSIVIKASCNGSSALLTGDASNQSENAMISSGADLSSDILMVGHHGSAAATSEEFLNSVNPQYAVISCGSDNKFRHPAQDTMTRLQNRNLNLFRTDLQGTVTATLDGNGISWNTEPSGDYSGRDVDTPAASEEIQGQTTDTQVLGDSDITYVLNTNTLKFHYPDCNSVEKMASENRSDFTGTRDEAIAMGYDPCGNCHP